MRRFIVIIIVMLMACILISGTEGSKEYGVVYPVVNDIMLDGDANEVVLSNPVENMGKYLLKYEFEDRFTGEVFFETNWLEGGKRYRYNLGFVDRDVDCIAHIYAKSLETLDDINKLSIYFKIGVKVYE